MRHFLFGILIFSIIESSLLYASVEGKSKKDAFLQYQIYTQRRDEGRKKDFKKYKNEYKKRIQKNNQILNSRLKFHKANQKKIALKKEIDKKAWEKKYKTQILKRENEETKHIFFKRKKINNNKRFLFDEFGLKL